MSDSRHKFLKEIINSFFEVRNADGSDVIEINNFDYGEELKFTIHDWSLGEVRGNKTLCRSIELEWSDKNKPRLRRRHGILDDPKVRAMLSDVIGSMDLRRIGTDITLGQDVYGLEILPDGRNNNKATINLYIDDARLVGRHCRERVSELIKQREATLCYANKIAPS